MGNQSGEVFHEPGGLIEYIPVRYEGGKTRGIANTENVTRDLDGVKLLTAGSSMKFSEKQKDGADVGALGSRPHSKASTIYPSSNHLQVLSALIAAGVLQTAYHGQ